ncbi:UPD-GlcNAc transporter [Aspergillus luchuensis]|uniref:UPD-GlcNAc transporter n=1 Tax=Aspergillus kawachii TaxID=1069201 RepID=A0A146FQJ3_ASPKA|nr:UPD-GlcNAc transporter [Aspergillus luchuensis]
MPGVYHARLHSLCYSALKNVNAIIAQIRERWPVSIHVHPPARQPPLPGATGRTDSHELSIGPCVRAGVTDILGSSRQSGTVSTVGS